MASSESASSSSDEEAGKPSRAGAGEGQTPIVSKALDATKGKSLSTSAPFDPCLFDLDQQCTIVSTR